MTTRPLAITLIALGAITAAFAAAPADAAPIARESTPTHADPAHFAAAGSVDVAFTPGDRIDNIVIAAIDNAKHEILVNAYTFTARRIAAALVAAHKRGVAVSVIADLQQTRTLPQNVLPQLVAGGVDVWLDGNYQSAHNKVIVIDADTPAATTITGSYNFTVAAQFHNAENIVVLRDNPDVARAYRDNWLRLKQHVVRWTPNPPP